ncbi:thrombospondin-1-like isoform X2 [Ruditapes philippinarum]|uniref:thrombospondin-1-like isoform X2 n=1 Tax=Ruditapes philippinarum TaxID=129788 RepID=UPI00295BDE8D|nr:thrombospondin-1-like isoform X2 [Ruditapes philippinarum]
MDKIKLVIVMVAIIVDEMNCDTDCDCKTIKELQESMQKEIFQNKLEISRMNSRLRNIEASKRHWTGTNNKASNKESDGLSTTKSNTIDTLEAEVTRVNSTDVNKATIQSRLLKLIEAKLSSLSLQVQDLKKHDSKEYVLETIVNKTLSSEKRSRKKFESVLKTVVKNINNSVSEIRTETESLMDKYNETFVKGCDKSIGAMKVVTVNINKTMYEEINIITEALNHLTEKLSEANKKDGEWSSWESWGSCSVSCDGGIQSRLRTCSNPTPSLLGRFCDGSPDEMRICNKHQCLELNVAFTAPHRYKIKV